MGQQVNQPQTPPVTPPVAPVGGQIPHAGIYLQQQAQAEQAYQNALVDIEHRRSASIRDYGFLPGGGVDPNNNYGQIQNLWRNQAAAANQQELGLMSHGLRGGLANQAISNRKLAEGGQNLDLQNHYNTDMYNLAQERTQAEQTHSNDLLAAQQAAAQDAQQNEDYTPAIVPEAPPALPNQAQARRHVAQRRAQQARRRRGRRR
jgi:hypothetical protein